MIDSERASERRDRKKKRERESLSLSLHNLSSHTMRMYGFSPKQVSHRMGKSDCSHPERCWFFLACPMSRKAILDAGLQKKNKKRKYSIQEMCSEKLEKTRLGCGPSMAPKKRTMPLAEKMKFPVANGSGHFSFFLSSDNVSLSKTVTVIRPISKLRQHSSGGEDQTCTILGCLKKKFSVSNN